MGELKLSRLDPIQFALRDTESGAGRFTDFHLPALTFVEFLELTGLGSLVEEDESGLFSPDLTALIDYINFGGYPEAALSGVAVTFEPTALHAWRIGRDALARA